MLDDLELIFVTGKGGVGKTSVAAALAELAAHSGKRTLVCEMDAKGSLAAAFDLAELRFEPREIGPNLYGMAMNTEDSLREYLRLYVKVPFVGLGPLARTFDFVADAAPGVKEILAVGKLCYEVREQHYDLVVVDAEATGHIIGQIAAPSAIRELVHVGLVHEQTTWMNEILNDPSRTGVVVVTTPEEMPVNETVELLGRLDDETDVSPAVVVANRVLPALFDRRQEAVVERLGDAEARLVDAAGDGVRAVVDAAIITERRRRVGGGHLDRLRSSLSPDLPVVYVPELFTRSTGRRVVTQVADALADELEIRPPDSTRQRAR